MSKLEKIREAANEATIGKIELGSSSNVPEIPDSSEPLQVLYACRPDALIIARTMDGYLLTQLRGNEPPIEIHMPVTYHIVNKTDWEEVAELLWEILDALAIYGSKHHEHKLDIRVIKTPL